MIKQSKHKPLTYHLGNLLIGLAIGLLAFTYYPIVLLYLPSYASIVEAQNSPYSVSIPKIHAYSSVISDVDPWNESEYKKALENGIAEAKGFAKPGERGTVFLFTHSSLPPWEMTRVNSAFLRLGELEEGDEVVIKKDGVELKYKVTHKREVWPEQVDELLVGGDGERLILQTCTPIGTSLKRLLVFAKPY